MTVDLFFARLVRFVRRHRVGFSMVLLATSVVMPVFAGPVPEHRPLAGDWVPSTPGDELGYYNTHTKTFHLCTNRVAAGYLSCVAYEAPDVKGDLVPLMGRWQAQDSVDRPALYNPRTGRLSIFRFADCLPYECLGYGGLTLEAERALGVSSAAAVSGDWDGDGVDTVALVRDVPDALGVLRGRVTYFRAGHSSVEDERTLTFRPSSFQALSGRWPGTVHPGASLAFYQPSNRTLLLFDGHQAQTRSVSVNTSLFNVLALGGDWGFGGDTFGLYVPAQVDCPGSHCHRVGLYGIPGPADRGQAEQPYPHLDSRFPDDPGDPTP